MNTFRNLYSAEIRAKMYEETHALVRERPRNQGRRDGRRDMGGWKAGRLEAGDGRRRGKKRRRRKRRKRRRRSRKTIAQVTEL